VGESSVDGAVVLRACSYDRSSIMMHGFVDSGPLARRIRDRPVVSSR
jgi:hypothetical protein